MVACNPEKAVLRQNAATRTLVVAHRDFYVDGIVRILKTSQTAGTIVCVEPGEPCTRHFVGTPPDFLLIQDNAKPEPFEDFIHEMVDGFPDMRLLVFGQSMSDDYLFRLIRAGAHGYFNEKMSGAHIIQALDAVSNGEYWVERRIMQRFITGQSLMNEINTRVREVGERLTPREVEVLEHVLQGLTTAEIAERIFLSHQGVKAHLTALFRKFKVKNRSQLILSALDELSPVDSITGLFQRGLQALRQPDEQPEGELRTVTERVTVLGG